jgi:hypothetical protein
MHQSPQVSSASAEQTLEELKDQLGKAKDNMDGPLMGEIEAKIKTFQAQEEAKLEEKPSAMEAVHTAVASGNPEAIAEAQAVADEKYIVDPELHDAHVERRNEEMRNNFLKSLAENTPDRTASFRRIAGRVSDLIKEEPNYSSKIQEVRDREASRILGAIEDARERIEDNCIPAPESLERAAKAFGTNVEDMKTRAFQAIRDKLSGGDSDLAIFDVLTSSESVENKKEALRKLTSKPVTNPGNY